MIFGLIANLKRGTAKEVIRAAISWGETWGKEHKQEMVLCDDLRATAPDYDRFCPRSEIGKRCDVVISMGGDGTLLAAARAVGNAETPLLGINLGSLGFLTQQGPDMLIPALEAIAEGDYRVEERLVLKAEIDNHDPLAEPYALNDVVLNNGPVSRVIDIDLFANGEKVVRYMADGLIIATPTGSTAYSLAVGGPVVKPTVKAMIASPISPFALTMRPMVFSSDDVLELTLVTEDRQASLTLDGQIMVPLDISNRVTIRKAEFSTRLVVFPQSSYYKVLRSKLSWGVPPKP